MLLGLVSQLVVSYSACSGLYPNACWELCEVWLEGCWLEDVMGWYLMGRVDVVGRLLGGGLRRIEDPV